ncbi:MAG TPA: hypothetical protein DEF51_24920 [Myxococcales bacterium]|nr:hypothetical protein [Myxococcales bacterium]
MSHVARAAPASFDVAGATRNDCNMMVVTGGQRSEAELRALYERSGFTLETHSRSASRHGRRRPRRSEAVVIERGDAGQGATTSAQLTPRPPL